jgi:hypothetical protein
MERHPVASLPLVEIDAAYYRRTAAGAEEALSQQFSLQAATPAADLWRFAAFRRRIGVGKRLLKSASSKTDRPWGPDNNY